MELPEKRIHVLKVDMLREQRSKYERWVAAARRFVEAHLEADTLLRHYSSVLEALLRCPSGPSGPPRFLPGSLCARACVPSMSQQHPRGLMHASASLLWWRRCCGGGLVARFVVFRGSCLGP